MSPLHPQGSDPGPLRIGLVDRSAELEDLLVSAAERGGVAADLGVVDPPSALGATSEREDVLVLGRKELSSAGLKRLTRYHATNPLTVVIAVGADPTGADRDALRAAGVSLVVKGEPTLS